MRAFQRFLRLFFGSILRGVVSLGSVGLWLHCVRGRCVALWRLVAALCGGAVRCAAVRCVWLLCAACGCGGFVLRYSMQLRVAALRCVWLLSSAVCQSIISLGTKRRVKPEKNIWSIDFESVFMYRKLNGIETASSYMRFSTSIGTRALYSSKYCCIS